MKTKFTFLLVISFTLFQSCQNEDKKINSENKPLQSISGTWTLFKVDKGDVTVDYTGKPTAVSLTLKDNGYFIFFDKITDEKMNESGVGKIQERYKGQYKLNDNKLTMNHYEGDSLITEIYSVEKISEKELVLKENSNTQYFKK